MNAASQAITHSGTTTLAISSGGDITLAAGSTKDVTIEDVHIAGLTIGTANNADLLTLADAKVTVDSEIELSASAAKITHENAAGGLTIESSYGYVDVEDIRFTGAKIGVAADIDVITLSSGGVAVAGTLDTTGLATFASATVTGTFTASGSFTVGTTLGVTGATTLTGTTLMKESVTLDKTAATITHTDAAGTPAGSLTISSTTGNVVISAKTGSTVDVESIRFTDAKIGLTQRRRRHHANLGRRHGTVAVAEKLTTERQRRHRGLTRRCYQGALRQRRRPRHRYRDIRVRRPVQARRPPDQIRDDNRSSRQPRDVRLQG